MTQAEIAAHIESIIPAELLKRYTHLSYAEMAEVPELEEWADALMLAEKQWFAADK